ncbi:hypothetical protein JCM10213_008437 [Rhodosporidiobolus nylandii]
MPDKTPVVQPIQQGSAQPPSSANSEPIHPSSAVDDGPSDSALPPSQASSSTRSDAQDALSGQSRSSRPPNQQDVAPAAREQEKEKRESEETGKGGMGGRESGVDDFRMREGQKGEPAAGKVHGSGNSDSDLVEAGTTMAGDAAADGGSDMAKSQGRSSSSKSKPKL